MALAQLSIDLTAKIASFEAELKRASDLAEQQSNKIAAAMGMVGKVAGALGLGAAAAQLTGLITSTADYADEMGKLAQKAGVTTEAVSALAYAASLADVDNQTLAKGLRELGEDAAKGGEKLRILGVGIKDAQGNLKGTDVLFAEVAERIASIEDPALKAAAAAGIFGAKAGPELVPLLNAGAQGIKDATKEAKEFGRVVTDEAAKAAEEFNDRLTRLQARLAGIGQTLASPVITGLNGFIDLIDGAVKKGSVAMLARDVIKLNNDVKALEERKSNPFVNQAALDKMIADTKAKLEVAKKLFRDANAEMEGSGKPTESTDKPKPPTAAEIKKLLGETDKAPKNKTEHDAAAQSLASYVQQLHNQVQATQELSNVEEARLFLKGLGATGEVAQVRELVQGLAQQKDAAEALKQTEKDRADEIAFRRALVVEEGEAINQANTAWQDYLKSLDDQTPDGRLERQRKLMADLAAEFEAGRSTAEQFAQRAQVALGTLPKDIKEADDAAQKLGLTFSSAFEDAIVNGRSLKELVNSLGKDILRIAVRKSITEPLGNAVGGFFKNLFSFDGGGYTGSGPRSGGMDGKGGYLAMLHPQETVVDHTKGQAVGGRTVVVNQTYNFGNGSNRSEVLTAAQLGAAMARNQVRDDMARGRL